MSINKYCLCFIFQFKLFKDLLEELFASYLDPRLFFEGFQSIHLRI
jgi:hypothetical protein